MGPAALDVPPFLRVNVSFAVNALDQSNTVLHDAQHPSALTLPVVRLP
jgi:hypothetical protein